MLLDASEQAISAETRLERLVDKKERGQKISDAQIGGAVLEQRRLQAKEDEYNSLIKLQNDIMDNHKEMIKALEKLTEYQKSVRPPNAPDDFLFYV